MFLSLINEQRTPGSLNPPSSICACTSTKLEAQLEKVMGDLKKKSSSLAIEDETSHNNLFNLKVINSIHQYQKTKVYSFYLATQRWLCVNCR